MDKIKLSKTYKIHTLYNDNIYQGMWYIYTYSLWMLTVDVAVVALH